MTPACKKKGSTAHDQNSWLWPTVASVTGVVVVMAVVVMYNRKLQSTAGAHTAVVQLSTWAYDNDSDSDGDSDGTGCEGAPARAPPPGTMIKFGSNRFPLRTGVFEADDDLLLNADGTSRDVHTGDTACKAVYEA